MKTSNPLRQKLINMMYLVLIAMIVLNPALEYIDIFTDLNRSLEYANVRLDQRNSLTVATIETFSKLDPDKYGDVYKRVSRAKQVADSTINFLEEIKQDMITAGDGYDPKWHHLKKSFNSTYATNKIYRDKKGIEIKERLKETKLLLLEVLNDSVYIAMLDTVLRVDDTLPKAKQVYYEWDKYYFNNVPLGAAVAVITKFQNDVRVAEALVMKNFHDQVQGEGGIGNSYNFEFIASDDSTAVDTIRLAQGVKKYDVFTIGEDGYTTVTLPSNKTGKGNGDAIIYQYDENNNIVDSFLVTGNSAQVPINTSQLGDFSMKGVVKFRHPDDPKPNTTDNQQLEEKKKKEEEMPFQINYSVVQSKPYISQKEYNILYLGINNPINVYHPEYAPDKYKISISQGKVTKVDSFFYANVYRKGFANVTLQVPDGNGGYKVVAEEIFKVKELPKPQVVLYNKEGGDIPAKILKMQKGLEAITKEMEIPADFRVVEYSITYVNASGLGIFKERVKGSYFTGKSRELIDLAQPGDIFIFDEIRVKGPDGVNKEVDALVFNVL